jgi:D-alanine-D-alanine ligase
VNEQRKIRVAVVFGGRGPEHAVSCMGGGNMLRSIDRDKYEVIPVGITREGNWLLAADEPARLAVNAGELPSVEAVAQPGSEVVPWAGQSLTASAPAQVPGLLGEVDVVLPVLHGPYGEDGTIQGLLEMAGVPYVGAGVLASAVSLDKEYMKIIFQARGLPVGPHVVVRPRDWPLEDADSTDVTTADLTAVERKRVLDAITELGWPVFVKPARGGSSFGTSKASDMAQLHAAIADARRYDPKVIVEAAIGGGEIECSVLEGVNGAPPDTSLPGKLLIAEGFYDFEAKYLGDTGMTIPAPIPERDQQEIRRMAALAFEAVSCEGLARVDFFYTPAGQIIINEINTIPGLSPTSYFQKMWEASGMQFGALVDRLLQTALNKGPGLR